ncbi:hypothetical protein HK105_204104 [Polyrhizophydium stewartii]|uniref:ABC transporter domain-containing protein n=1 Tax=Polyrhizophydium stewartii TaxID=2732419 RepID=A0ABR4N9Z2_9FUNG
MQHTTFVVEKPQSNASSTTSEQTGFFAWHDVSLSIAVPAAARKAAAKAGGDAPTHKTLIQGMNGIVRAGEVVAIMGGSGAGKSTLLNTLAGRIGPGDIGGTITVNGKPRNPATWQTECAYVEQDDLMHSTLTVEETIAYSAHLRLPSTMSRAEKAARVDQIIMDLGLNSCRATRIGDHDTRGISGGERKRVSIGIELVTNPAILFLDEPTSGLDAFTAYNVIANIKDIAKQHNKIVLMTIHQPRTDILALFDTIVLLSTGKTVWFGTTHGALDHFASLGFSLPPQTNPSDHFLDIITLDQRSDALRTESQQRIERFVEAWRKSAESLSFKGDIEAATRDAEASLVEQANWVEGGWKTSWAVEFGTLLDRNFKNTMRSSTAFAATVTQSAFMMLVVGFVFFRSNDDYRGIQNKFIVIFFICINLTFAVVAPVVSTFPAERLIITRERAAGTYRASSAFASKWISTLPMLVVSTLVFSMPLYWMVGLRDDSIGHYFFFLLVLVVHANTANALGLLIGSGVKDAQIGQVFAPIVITLLMMFSGELVNLEATPVVFRWIQYVSIIAITNKALAQNEFLGRAFECTDTRGVCYRDGQQVLDTFVLSSPGMWVSVGQNLAIMAVLLALGFLMFSRTSQPKLRLK